MEVVMVNEAELFLLLISIVVLLVISLMMTKADSRRCRKTP
jgi:hypothetical protein